MPGSPACCAAPPSSGVTLDPAADVDLLTHEREGDLLRALGEFPRIVATAATERARRTGSRATSRSWPAPTTASTTRAGCCRKATRRPTPLTAARLLLVEATRIVIANGLGLLGVSAPERM